MKFEIRRLSKHNKDIKDYYWMDAEGNLYATNGPLMQICPKNGVYDLKTTNGKYKKITKAELIDLYNQH